MSTLTEKLINSIIIELNKKDLKKKIDEKIIYPIVKNINKYLYPYFFLFLILIIIIIILNISIIYILLKKK